jgi:hypothetical protein
MACTFYSSLTESGVQDSQESLGMGEVEESGPKGGDEKEEYLVVNESQEMLLEDMEKGEVLGWLRNPDLQSLQVSPLLLITIIPLLFLILVMIPT